MNNTTRYGFIVIKPDALRQFLDINILQLIQQSSLEIVMQKAIRLKPEQVKKTYVEKLPEPYYPLLQEFMSKDASICIVVRSHENALAEAHRLKDQIRQTLKLKTFSVTKDDLELLRAREHPQQAEITKEMALENLIHSSDTFDEVLSSIIAIFDEDEIKDLAHRDPELGRYLQEYRQEQTEGQELSIH